VSLLRDAGATVLVHLGDLEDPEILEELLVIAATEVHVVPGNMDDPQEIAAAARRLGIHCPGLRGELHLASKRIAFTHGHAPEALEALRRDPPDYLLYGHTHVAADERQGATRWINPGALHRANPYRVALLDPAADRVEHLVVEER
jgi:putative phosphoesterase